MESYEFKGGTNCTPVGTENGVSLSVKIWMISIAEKCHSLFCGPLYLHKNPYHITHWHVITQYLLYKINIKPIHKV